MACNSAAHVTALQKPSCYQMPVDMHLLVQQLAECQERLCAAYMDLQ